MRARRRRPDRIRLGSLTAVLAPGDFSGDGRPDLLARTAAGALLMYRGDGDGGFLTGSGEPIGSGWETFSALLAPGDFSGDGRPGRQSRAGLCHACISAGRGSTQDGGRGASRSGVSRSAAACSM